MTQFYVCGVRSHVFIFLLYGGFQKICLLWFCLVIYHIFICIIQHCIYFVSYKHQNTALVTTLKFFFLKFFFYLSFIAALRMEIKNIFFFIISKFITILINHPSKWERKNGILTDFYLTASQHEKRSLIVSPNKYYTKYGT